MLWGSILNEIHSRCLNRIEIYFNNICNPSVQIMLTERKKKLQNKRRKKTIRNENLFLLFRSLRSCRQMIWLWNMYAICSFLLTKTRKPKKTQRTNEKMTNNSKWNGRKVELKTKTISPKKKRKNKNKEEKIILWNVFVRAGLLYAVHFPDCACNRRNLVKSNCFRMGSQKRERIQ